MASKDGGAPNNAVHVVIIDLIRFSCIDDKACIIKVIYHRKAHITERRGGGGGDGGPLNPYTTFLILF